MSVTDHTVSSAAVHTSGPNGAIVSLLNPFNMIRTLYRHRNLIRKLTHREVVARYRESYLGLVWSVLTPLLMLGIYAFVFLTIFQARTGAGPNGGKAEFVLNLFCGLTLFNVFGTCVGKSPRLILTRQNLVKQVIFPLEVLPFTVLGAALVDGAISFVLLVGASCIFAQHISATMLLFPLVLIPLCALILGCTWLISSIGVFLRDLEQFVQTALRFLFFASPVLYSVEMLPAHLRWVMYLNPLTPILEGGKATLVNCKQPEWLPLAAVTVAALALMQLGYAWFMKTKGAFVDVM